MESHASPHTTRTAFLLLRTRYYNKWLALLGCILCLLIMFVVNWLAALITLLVVAVLYKYVEWMKPDVNWGSASQAQTYINALSYMLRLSNTEDHVKNFRCVVVVTLPPLPPNHLWLVDPSLSFSCLRASWPSFAFCIAAPHTKRWVVHGFIASSGGPRSVLLRALARLLLTTI